MVCKRKTDDGRDYWSARDLSTALGYSTWQKFNRVLNKALQEEATIRKIPIVQLEGDREVNRSQLMYNLDAIIAVGYRVNSYKATLFRIWATEVLREFIIKGFVLDDERLKQGKHFGQD